jgi:hypothetical protein
LTSEKGIAGDCLDWTHLVRSPQELFQILGLGAFVRAEDSVQRLSAAPSHAAVEDVVGEANALGTSWGKGSNSRASVPLPLMAPDRASATTAQPWGL